MPFRAQSHMNPPRQKDEYLKIKQKIKNKIKLKILLDLWTPI
jgi:hypothetical protein